jgi:hypothetical protein
LDKTGQITSNAEEKEMRRCLSIKSAAGVAGVAGFEGGPHEFASLNRRGFIAMTVKATLLLALGGKWRSTALAAPETGGWPAAYALNPVAPLGGTLGTPAAAGGSFTKWSYRWVFNKLSRKNTPLPRELDDLGSLEIERTASGDRVEYRVAQKRLFGDYESTMVCGTGSGEPLMEWKTRQATPRENADPLVSEVTGRVDGSKLEMKRAGVRETVDLTGPLHSEVTFLAQPACLAAVADRGISLLEGGAMVRPAVRVRRDPATDTSLDGVSATAWLMTGQGLLPTHIMTDDGGRALCRTMFTTSLILQEITA